MSTIPLNHDQSAHSSFDAIDAHVNRLQLGATPGQPAAGQNRLERLRTVYAGVRPILAALSATPFIPSRWRETLLVFVALLDEMTVAEPSAVME